jgi:hypothetical protein
MKLLSAERGFRVVQRTALTWRGLHADKGTPERAGKFNKGW